MLFKEPPDISLRHATCSTPLHVIWHANVLQCTVLCTGLVVNSTVELYRSNLANGSHPLPGEIANPR